MGQEEGSTHPAARAGAVLLPMALTVPGTGWEGRVWGQEQGERANPPPEPQQQLKCLLQEAGRDLAAEVRLSWLLSELPLALHPSPDLFPTPSSPFPPPAFLFWVQFSCRVTPHVLLPHQRYRWQQQDLGQAGMGQGQLKRPQNGRARICPTHPVCLRYEANERQFTELA